MFLKKNYENIIYITLYLLLILFFLYSKNSLFSHWSDILDQDVTLIYNSLIIGSNLYQEYLDHPAFTTFFILNFFYELGYYLNILDFNNIEELLKHTNKDRALQSLHNLSQFVHLIYSIILAIVLRKIIYDIVKDNLSSLFLTIIFLISPSFIFLFDLIRSEILSLLLIFLFYICLIKSIEKNIFYIIIAGFLFVISLLAKVQIILSLIPILILFFINSYGTDIKQKIKISNFINILINLLIISFVIFIIDNFFYKRIDKIFFIFIIFLLILIFFSHEKKITGKRTSNFMLFLFFIGGCISIFCFKILSIIGFAYFHPSLIDIITSPISQMSSISTGYSIGRSDNFEYLVKITNYFFETRKAWNINTFAFLNNKFNIITYILALVFILFFMYKKKYFEAFLIFTFNFSIILLILIFNFRPYFFYDIYILPLNLFLISIILKDLKNKKIYTFLYLITYLFLNFAEINNYLDQKRSSGIFDKKVSAENNMKIICKDESIINKGSYMRFWQSKYDENFLRDLCKSYSKNLIN
ncbi:glycosyltransferase family 39 protein [Candidatus Pelagibacter sp.]|nr:glycosyltransferase family 39 protein [Candidatus Pelagibacter sp.]